MKICQIALLFAALGAATFSSAQNFPPPCSAPPPLGASTCDQTCIYCELNGYTGSNLEGGPDNLLYCNQITVQTGVWHAFVAGSTSIAFEVISSNCMLGEGLQLAITVECNDASVLACNPGAAGTGNQTMVISSSGFVPGRVYYLLVDGWLSDVCDYQINVMDGAVGTVITAPPGVPQGSGAYTCNAASQTYTVSPVSGASYYHWTAPAGASINGMSDDEVLPGIGGNTVSITFGNNSGPVCVSVGNACSPETAASCRNVIVHPIPPTFLAPITVPFDQLPYDWLQDGSVDITTSGTFNLITTLTSFFGCDSVVQQIVTVLPPNSGTIMGTIYWDANDNGLKDPGEQPFASGAVVKSSTGQLTSSNINGQYSLQNLMAGDTVRVVAPLPGITVNPGFRKVQQGVSAGYDFGLFPLPDGYDLTVNLNATVFRPGFSTWMTVVCRNIGLQTASGVQVNLALPSLLQYVVATPNPSNINGNNITWDIGELQAGQSRNIQVEIKTPVSAMLGTPLTLEASILPLTLDLFPGNNFYKLNTGVVGAYDPNDKQVTPAFITPAMIADGLPFEYSIRFQNTGNFPADMVRIIDTLESMVDPSTFRFVAASHPCTWKIRGNRIVEFIFENINLPDSTSDEANSHGFVKFTLNPKKNLPIGTVVRNFCDIYFDFNDPIRTNTVGTEVVRAIPGEWLLVRDALRIRPNPASLFTNFEWKTPAPADGRVRIFDITGLLRLELPVATGQTYLQANISALPSGLYFVVLEAGNLVLANKLVVASLAPLGLD